MDRDGDQRSSSQSLANIGLTAAQEAVYRAVLTCPTMGVGDLSQVSGVGSDVAVDAVQALVARGLLEDAEGELIAVSPVLALGDVVASAEKEARLARAALDELADQYRAVRQERAVGGLEVVRGRSNIANWINHLLRSTEVQMRMFAKPPFAVVGISETEAMSMIVNGFIEPIAKELPLEYAVELNRLIQLEMEGSVG